MAEVIIGTRVLIDLEEIWGSEVVLSYPGLYAGQTDLVGVYQGRESIIDFKQSNKPKREEWIEDYYYQGVAYATAHDFIYGTRYRTMRDHDVYTGFILSTVCLKWVKI